MRLQRAVVHCREDCRENSTEEVRGCPAGPAGLLFTLASPALQVPVLTLPAHLADLSKINPLERIETVVSPRERYLLHITVPAVLATIVTVTIVILCTLNNRWYNFIESRKKGYKE